MARRVLFVCTGNFYRSRFAEAVFNHHAEARGSTWRAFSRGLATHLVNGELSEHVVLGLEARGIDRRHTGERPAQLTEADLRVAANVVALKESEHRRMFRMLHPTFVELVTYWEVHDIDKAPPAQVLPQIETQVLALLTRLMALEPRRPQ